VAQRVPGGLGSQIFMTFGTWRWWGCQPHAPAAFTHRKCSWYSFSQVSQTERRQQTHPHSFIALGSSISVWSRTVLYGTTNAKGCCSTRVKQHPSTRTQNLEPHTTPTTSHNQSCVPHSVNICIVSSSWWWA